MSEKVIVAWSGGKDSALALHETLESGRYEVRELLTTVTRELRDNRFYYCDLIPV
jgi:diphthamide synthase (EF-2-diphthine--ammonia ligase)